MNLTSYGRWCLLFCMFQSLSSLPLSLSLSLCVLLPPLPLPLPSPSLCVCVYRRLGLPPHDTFKTADLYDRQDLGQVLVCVERLGRQVGELV